MFYSLTGKIIKKSLSAFAIECGGVGFLCQASELTLAQLETGKTATVFTHLNVREDAMDLFGFFTEEELEWFRLLITVSGVGPKAALAVLSVLEPSKLSLSIAAGDSKVITRANGVGAKIAQRIVNELKSKVAAMPAGGEAASSVGSVAASDSKAEAVAALSMLGYSQTDASVAVGGLDGSLSVEELIRQSLKILSRQV